MATTTDQRAPIRTRWTLDGDVSFLNHGSFGACPRAVLEIQARLRAQMEAEPVRFFIHELEPQLAAVRTQVAAFVHCDSDDLVFVRNATDGCNAVLRSLRLEPDDEIVLTSHGYGAVNHCVEYVCDRAGAKRVVADVPFPIADAQEVVEAVLGAVTERTRLVVLDHVTSPTGLVFPIETIVRALRERGVETLIDGAHGPGMLDLDLDALGAGYYTGNFHKWMCAPKASGLLHVRRDLQGDVVPTCVSHGYHSPRARSRYLETFDWTGTSDPTPLLCVPPAMEFLQSIRAFGPRREKQRTMLLEQRRVLAEALGVALPAPDDMIGLLASLPLPDGDGAPPTNALYADPLQLQLYESARVEVPVIPWPKPPKRLIRLSAAPYNMVPEYERLLEALPTALAP
jgi:isopenicillin-N epimerase